MKQWGQAPDEIDPLVSGRVPIYVFRDDRYFQDKYQGIPIGGYTVMIRKMLNHPKIKVKLKTPYSKTMTAEKIFWTGAIDEFFGFKYGELPYRSERFEFLTFNFKQFQDVAVVNYPTNYNFTKIVEYKHFLNDQYEKTIVSYEYPEQFVRGKNERYYPISNDKNTELYNRYLKLSEKTPNINFLGRLGEYKYLDMDKAILSVLNLIKKDK